MFFPALTDTATCDWSVVRMRHSASFKNLHNVSAVVIGQKLPTGN